MNKNFVLENILRESSHATEYFLTVVTHNKLKVREYSQRILSENILKLSQFE